MTEGCWENSVCASTHFDPFWNVKREPQPFVPSLTPNRRKVKKQNSSLCTQTMRERKKNFFWPSPPLQISYLPDLPFPSPPAGSPEFSTIFFCTLPTPIASTHSALRSQLLITTTAVSGLLLNPLNVLSGCFAVLGLIWTPEVCLVLFSSIGSSQKNSSFRPEFWSHSY